MAFFSRCFRFSTIWRVILFMCIVVLPTLYLMDICFNLRLGLWCHGVLSFRSHSPNDSLPASTKVILYWNTLYGEESFYLGMGDRFADCPDIDLNNCYATNDRNMKNIEDFDAIMFHGSELRTWDLPNKRHSRQLYIYTNLESPANEPLPSMIFEDYFNLTMTYRLDSDIPWPYAILRDRNNGNVAYPLQPEVLWNTSFIGRTEDEYKVTQRGSVNNIQWSRGKTKTAAWFVSHCEAKSNRENYVDRLKKYVDVDIYGSCGSKHCGRDEDCFKKVVEPNYYFYLSFENSFCQDYLTEKLYNTMKYRVVPVVYGGANYTLFAPPKSYINALDYESPQDLAKYLKRLMERPNEYAEYFKWKERYQVAYPTKLVLCRLCRILNSKTPVKKIYNPLSLWYQKCPLQDILHDVPYITKLHIK